MSKDIMVLAPNGRRQTVKCTLNTTILQILEEVCKKQGFDPECYDLKHHNKVLDLSNTVRFSNLPNKASLEMVETDRKREENDVTIALQLENDERRTGQFKPRSSLYEVLQSLAASELPTVSHPTVVYMRREVHGREELEGTTLRQLGLTGGRAILRLLDMSLDKLRTQANVSSNLPPPRPITSGEPLCDTTISNNQSNIPESNIMESKECAISPEDCTPGPSNIAKAFTQMMNPIQLIRDQIKRSANANAIDERDEENDDSEDVCMEVDKPITEHSNETSLDGKSETSQLDEELLQRRLNIEQEVKFLGENKAIVFEQSSSEPELAELPDDFYDLTVDEVRKLYHELKQSASTVSNTPLLTAGQRAALSNSEKKTTYKHAVVRVQFPDRVILQGVFKPTDTIENVYSFTRQYLEHSDRPFNLLTTPTRENLEPSLSLQDAGFVPGVLLHFRWTDKSASQHRCLKQSIYDNTTSSDAAAILASKYRAPVRQKREITQEQQRRMIQHSHSSSKDGKIPKWLKL